MAHVNNIRYSPVPDDEQFTSVKDERADEEFEYDPSSGLMGTGDERRLHPRTASSTVSRILAVANLILFVVLVGTWLGVMKSSNEHRATELVPPYSKVREDGAVKLINKKFKPHLIFQSEPSAEVDAAWNRTMQYDNSVGVTKEVAREHHLPRSVELPNDTNIQLYGVSVFHQLHCLDIIRQALYPERYFPDHSRQTILSHKNHCLDFLRQAIMCKADVSMIYWWNSNYTTIGQDGVSRNSDYYLSLSAKERVKHSFVKWDVEHQCHDLDLVIDWLGKYGIDRPW